LAREAVVEISYIGKVITKNHYKYKGGIYTRPEATAWGAELGWTVKELSLDEWKLPLKITVSGRFKDKRSEPDLQNTFELISDSIEDACGVNDKHYRFNSGTVEYGDPPVLWIKIEENAEVLR